MKSCIHKDTQKVPQNIFSENATISNVSSNDNCKSEFLIYSFTIWYYEIKFYDNLLLLWKFFHIKNTLFYIILSSDGQTYDED